MHGSGSQQPEPASRGSPAHRQTRPTAVSPQRGVADPRAAAAFSRQQQKRQLLQWHHHLLLRQHHLLLRQWHHLLLQRQQSLAPALTVLRAVPLGGRARYAQLRAEPLRCWTEL